MKHENDNHGSVIPAKEFEREAKKLLKKFLAVWAKEHEKRPQEFPKEMDLGEWWDQFDAFGNSPADPQEDDSDA